MAYDETPERPKASPDTSRPDAGPMDEEEVQSLVTKVIQDSVNFSETELSFLREKSTNYYLGKPFGNEEDGRSKIVLTEVRDSVQATIPQMMRVFFGPENVIEYEPAGPDDVDAAAQATDYANYVFLKDNPGFMLAHSAIKDGLVRKLGAFKWGWEETAEDKHEKLENVDDAELQMLGEDDDVTLVSVVSKPAGDGTKAMVHDVELTRKGDGRVVIYAIPGEELIYTPEARSPDDALFIGHQMDKTRGELIALGIKASLLDELGDARTLRDAPEVIARREGAMGAVSNIDPDGGDANDKIRYVEGFLRADVDGDGINELRRVCTVGEQYKLASHEPADDVNISVWCPDPEPHTISGLSMADNTMDLQLAKSSIARATLDSLALSIFPRTEYVEGMVNVADLMNTEIGANIRTRAPGQMREVKHTFAGQDALSVLEYFDEIKESRVGVNKGAAGIDADALQSSTKAAVGATVTAAQLRTELLCRFFAEQALKPLFRGILKLLVQHQPRKRMAKLRGQWVEVDPRSWNADMDVTVNVGLGVGFTDQKVQTLQGVIEYQSTILQQYGPTNPLVTLAQHSRTLRQALALEGFKNGTAYFNDVPDDWQPPQPQGPPPPNPEMELVKIEGMKAQHAAQMREQELQLKVQQAQLDMQRANFETEQKAKIEQMKVELQREQMAQDYALRLEEMKLKYGTTLAKHEVETNMADAQEKERLGSEAVMRNREMDMEHERGLYEIDQNAQTDRQAAPETTE